MLLKLEFVGLWTVISCTQIIYDPNPVLTVVEEDKEFVEIYYEMPEDEIDTSQLSPWLLRIELKREAMAHKELTMKAVGEFIGDVYGSDLSLIYNDDHADKLVLRLRIMNRDEVPPTTQLNKAAESSSGDDAMPGANKKGGGNDKGEASSSSSEVPRDFSQRQSSRHAGLSRAAMSDDESQETPTIVVPEKNADVLGSNSGSLQDLFGSASDSDDEVKGKAPAAAQDSTRYIGDAKKNLASLKRVEASIYQTNAELRGVSGLTNVQMRDRRVVRWDEEDGVVRNDANTEWILDTVGSNLCAVLAVPGVDFTRTVSNCPVETNQV
jgi:hypothetical protein